jgi:ribosomal protein S18 acetylase RimI-like enzyme
MIEVRPLDAGETKVLRSRLCSILAACVTGGASVGFMAPYAQSDAEPFWDAVAASVQAGDVVHLGAFVGGVLAGTVQVSLKMPPNQPHRGDIKKLLVHPDFRGQGVARALMRGADNAAAKAGRTLLVLDTASGSDADFLYPKLGWEVAGVIPDYALYPDGRFCDTKVYFKRLSTAD